MPHCLACSNSMTDAHRRARNACRGALKSRGRWLERNRGNGLLSAPSGLGREPRVCGQIAATCLAAPPRARTAWNSASAGGRAGAPELATIALENSYTYCKKLHTVLQKKSTSGAISRDQNRGRIPASFLAPLGTTVLCQKVDFSLVSIWLGPLLVLPWPSSAGPKLRPKYGLSFRPAEMHFCSAWPQRIESAARTQVVLRQRHHGEAALRSGWAKGTRAVCKTDMGGDTSV